ncbi:MAG: prepilin-type N-terminal cleavage/methylation domain-containing protein, partial [Gammaproteobacteria bacterium]
MQINTQKIRSTLSHQQGLSLIELMIAMTLGLMIVAGMATLFVQTRKSFTQDEMIAQMQDDARFAMNEIVRDVSLGGFWATLLDPVNITVDTAPAPALANDCGDGTANWMYQT